MKTYRESMNELQFSPQQKQQMIDRLMTQAARPPRGRAIPLRRVCALGAAAALAGALCLGAAASGVLKPAAQAFGAVFGTAPAQTEIIDRIGYPLNASDTANGVTVQADAIIGDTYSYAIVYSIFREDGQPLADDLVPDGEDYLPLRFDDWGADVGHMGGMHGTAYFFDEDPADNAVQFVELLTADSPLKPGTATVELRDLELYSNDDYRLLAGGSWNLRFDFAFEDCSLTWDGGQALTVNGAAARLNSVSLSPLSFRVDYTVSASLPKTDDDRIDPTADAYLQALDISLTLTDGTRVKLENSGGGLQPEGDSLRCEKSGIFEEIIPLDTIESITIGDVTLPVANR